MAGWWSACATGSMIGWIPFVVWNVSRVILRVIDRVSATRYERVRSRAIVELLQALPEGFGIRDQRSDGTILTVSAAVPAAIRGRDAEDPGAPTEQR